MHDRTQNDERQQQNDPSGNGLTSLLVERHPSGNSDRSLDRHTGIQPTVHIECKFHCWFDDDTPSANDEVVDGCIHFSEHEEPELRGEEAHRKE